jgi:hypothetical protein
MAAAQAVEYDAQGKPLPASPQGVEYDAEGKPLPGVSGTVSQGESPNYPAGTTVVNPTAGQIGKGVLREGANLLSGAHAFGRKALEMIPGVSGSSFDQSMQRHQGQLDELARPRNLGEDFGRTGAEMASYLAPMKAESMAAEGAERLPGLLRPLARIGTSAVSNAAMSGMNRESPAVGGAVGAGFGALGEGWRLLANPLMRSAIPGKISSDTADALLNETRGIRPSTVLSSTENRIGQAGRDLDASVAAANQRSAPRIAGYLMPPQEEIPLHAAPAPRNPKMQPMAFPAKINPEEPMEPRSGNPMADISEFPSINPHYLSGSEHPELSGRVTPLQNPQQVTTRMGVLLRRPEMSASIPPTTEPNRMISTGPALRPAEAALGTAARQRVPGDVDQIQSLVDFLRGHGEYGPERSDLLTPQEALDARRGFGKNFVSNRQWTQVVNSAPLAAAKEGYGGLTSELHAQVPGAIEADEMMHKLIPARNGLRTLVRDDPSVAGNVMGRVGARTGALTSAAMGAAGGARSAGLPGMIVGGAAGLLAPEIMSAPAAKMAMARAMYSPVTPLLGRAVSTPIIDKLMDYLRPKRTGEQEQ